MSLIPKNNADAGYPKNLIGRVELLDTSLTILHTCPRNPAVYFILTMKFTFHKFGSLFRYTANRN